MQKTETTIRTIKIALTFLLSITALFYTLEISYGDLTGDIDSAIGDQSSLFTGAEEQTADLFPEEKKAFDGYLDSIMKSNPGGLSPLEIGAQMQEQASTFAANKEGQEYADFLGKYLLSLGAMKKVQEEILDKVNNQAKKNNKTKQIENMLSKIVNTGKYRLTDS